MKRGLELGESAALAVRIPKALQRAVHLQAITEERLMQEWIREALTEHLARCRGPRRARPAPGMPQEGA
jgi:hypothetical protein